MIYSDFKGKRISSLGFGTMRLPTDPDGSVNISEVEKMTELAISSGVNYFDTAYPYHGGMSEVIIGKVLSKYPRASYCLADKYPGHQIMSSYDPGAVFEEQLKKCGVDYFDFYLLHNVYEESVNVYLDEKLGIIDYFKEQKRQGRIKHLGFSSHAKVDTLRTFLDAAGSDMEFCMIELNWLDWTLQDAKRKVELLNEYDMPIFVMEPLRGGLLARLGDADSDALAAIRPDESVPAWSFRFLQGIKGVAVVLSGMSNIEQMKDNIATFTSHAPLSSEENRLLLEIAEGMKSSVPCTACRYCTAGCPASLNIPELIAAYNDISVEERQNPTMWIEALPADKQPSACISCGKCTKICPQGIDIPDVMRSLSQKLERLPKWRQICLEREEAAKRVKNY